MVKMKERSVNVSGKPKHSLDVNRTETKNRRSAATVRRLKMYDNRPKRDSKGTILRHDFQSKDLPCTRIVPDRRWFAPPKLENASGEPEVSVKENETVVDDNQASAAFRAIANVISSQQQKTVPVQRDLYTDTEMKGEGSDQPPATEPTVA